jgi:DNA repair protein RecO (recombination protein O)
MAHKPVRVADEPAFVLHRHDWSETSLILEVLSRHHGRVVLVAKGAKRPTSQLRPVLLPLQPLLLSWGGDGEVRTLKAAHWRGGHVMPVGEALMAGLYLNEMLLRLLARDDPHPRLFDVYTQTVHRLSGRGLPPDPALLRAFELMLLRESGVLPLLSEEGSNLEPLQPRGRYLLSGEGGLRRAEAHERLALSGEQWLAVQQALDSDTPLEALARVCAPSLGGLQPQLRQVLHYHSGVRAFRTRQLMLDVQALVRNRPQEFQKE